MKRYNGQKKLSVLSFDGGGTRGIFSLIMLRRISISVYGEEKTDEERTKLIMNNFDVICGTSTGAIIATGLACGYTIDKMINIYKDLMQKIFYPSKLAYPRRNLRYLRSGNFYNQDLLKSIFLENFGTRKLNSIKSKKLMIIATDATKSEWNSHVFASYNNNSDIDIVTALLASTAAPRYFAPVSIGTKKFIDGGGGANNPTELAIFQLHDVLKCEIRYTLSLGTGMLHPSTGSFSMWGEIQEIIKLATNSNAIHLRIMEWLSFIPDKIQYFRFSPPNLGSLPLDTCDLGIIEKGISDTEAYMSNESKKMEVLKSSF